MFPYRFSITVGLAAVATVVCAKDIDIDVGEEGIRFEPNTTMADVGDVLNFHFYSATGPHSVVSGAFDSPCAPAANAFFSGLIDGNDAGNSTYIINVTSTDPIWYYCSAHKHCQGGMVGVINPPSTNDTLEAYAKAASSVSAASAPSAPVGGVATTVSAASTTDTSSMDMTMSMSSSMSMSGSALSSATSAAASKASSAASSAASASETSKSGSEATAGVKIGLGAVLGGMVALLA
ncbi:putative GPI-anchored cupredoxin [Lachnellula subtilissima]|uniref:Putative GPI-anchored cupredoxin n=1 Tax=Lachnellula subtilissima TaxID=602034 RepID=A0A8H8UEJ1_9HELO|nr:putative GPI-anchored cupredoxin [Lachnellula subtilissima]